MLMSTISRPFPLYFVVVICTICCFVACAAVSDNGSPSFHEQDQFLLQTVQRAIARAGGHKLTADQIANFNAMVEAKLGQDRGDGVGAAPEPITSDESGSSSASLPLPGHMPGGGNGEHSVDTVEGNLDLDGDMDAEFGVEDGGDGEGPDPSTINIPDLTTDMIDDHSAGAPSDPSLVVPAPPSDEEDVVDEDLQDSAASDGVEGGHAVSVSDPDSTTDRHDDDETDAGDSTIVSAPDVGPRVEDDAQIVVSEPDDVRDNGNRPGLPSTNPHAIKDDGFGTTDSSVIGTEPVEGNGDEEPVQVSPVVVNPENEIEGDRRGDVTGDSDASDDIELPVIENPEEPVDDGIGSMDGDDPTTSDNASGDDSDFVAGVVPEAEVGKRTNRDERFDDEAETGAVEDPITSNAEKPAGDLPQDEKKDPTVDDENSDSGTDGSDGGGGVISDGDDLPPSAGDERPTQTPPGRTDQELNGDGGVVSEGDSDGDAGPVLVEDDEISNEEDQTRSWIDSLPCIIDSECIDTGAEFCVYPCPSSLHPDASIAVTGVLLPRANTIGAAFKSAQIAITTAIDEVNQSSIGGNNGHSDDAHPHESSPEQLEINEVAVAVFADCQVSRVTAVNAILDMGDHVPIISNVISVNIRSIEHAIQPVAAALNMDMPSLVSPEEVSSPMGVALARYAYGNGHNRLSVVSSLEGGYCTSLSRSFHVEASRLGIEVVESVYVSRKSSATEIKATLITMHSESSVNVFMAALSLPLAMNVFTVARNMDLTGSPYTWLGVDEWVNADIASIPELASAMVGSMGLVPQRNCRYEAPEQSKPYKTSSYIAQLYYNVAKAVLSHHHENVEENSLIGCEMDSTKFEVFQLTDVEDTVSNSDPAWKSIGYIDLSDALPSPPKKGDEGDTFSTLDALGLGHGTNGGLGASTDVFGKLSSTTLLIVGGVTTLGILLAVALMCFTIVYRREAMIKMSSPEMHALILLGCILGYAAIFLILITGFDMPPLLSTCACNGRVAFLSVGFSFSFGGMLVTIYRVHIIFNNPSMEPRVVATKKLFHWLGYILLLDIVILGAWNLLDPLHKTQDSPAAASLCTSEYDYWFYTLIYCTKGLLLLIGSVLAYRIRNVWVPAMNDSRFIGLTIYTTTLLSGMYLALSPFLQDRYDVHVVFTSLIVWFAITVCLVALFVPKIHAIVSGIAQDMTRCDGGPADSRLESHPF